jgi:hypothetical protein
MNIADAAEPKSMKKYTKGDSISKPAERADYLE